MFSLSVLIAVVVVATIFQSWTIAWAARKVGSPRGRMRVALGAFILLLIINTLLSYLKFRLVAPDGAELQSVAVVYVLLSLAIVLVVMRKAFQLSFKATWAPLAAYFASGGVVIAFYALAVKPHVTEAFVLPTRSMMPTINPGDRFMVSRISQPRRWDLVAYWNTGPERAIFCKRLIGLPGDHVRFEGGTIYINDQPANVPAILAGRCRASTPGWTEPKYAEGQTISLGPDEYFFIGDNIDISGDSRHAGPSKRSSLVGVVDFIYWPLDKMKILR